MRQDFPCNTAQFMVTSSAQLLSWPQARERREVLCAHGKVVQPAQPCAHPSPRLECVVSVGGVPWAVAGTIILKRDGRRSLCIWLARSERRAKQNTFSEPRAMWWQHLNGLGTHGSSFECEHITCLSLVLYKGERRDCWCLHAVSVINVIQKRTRGSDNSLKVFLKNLKLRCCTVCVTEIINAMTHTFFLSLSSPALLRHWTEMEREEENDN